MRLQDSLEALVNDDVPLAPAGLGTSVLAEHPAPPDADSPVTQVDVAAAERDRLRWPCSRPEAQDQAGRRAARTRRGRGRHIGTRAGASAEDALRGRASSRPFLRLPLTHGSARRLRSPRAETTALSRLSAVIARWRLRRIARRRLREVPREIPMKARVLLLAFAVGCSASTVRVAETAREPVGCCCSYGDCRERFTRRSA